MRAMVDAILAGAGDAAFEANDLRDKAIVPRQRDATRIQQGQQITIKIAFRLLGHFVTDAVLTERLFDEFTTVVIADHLVYTIKLEQGGEAVDDSRRRERRPRLAHHHDLDLLLWLRGLIRKR